MQNIRLVGGAILIVTLSGCAVQHTAIDQKAAATNGCSGTDHSFSGICRSYSSDDIGRTGAITPGEALRLLDPALTVR